MLPVSFQDFSSVARSLGGVVVPWPFTTGPYAKYFDQPAARFNATDYVAASRTGRLDFSQPQQTSATNQYFYLLAPQTAWGGAPWPKRATALQSAMNTAFTYGDRGADALGLPSLKGIEDFLKRAGWIAGGALVLGVALAVRSVLPRGGRRER